MEYQKIIKWLENTPSQPTTFRTKKWVEINDESRGTYNTYSQIKFKNPVLRSSLCDYSDAYILLSGTVTVAEVAADAGNNGIRVVFKNCAPFTNCISEINNKQIDNAKYIDVVIPMYNLIEYSDNYSKTSGSVWQYYRDEPALAVDGTPANFPDNSASFKFKQKITGSTQDDSTKYADIMVPLKHLSKFWITLEMPFINCEINLILTWSANCVISNAAANQETTFAITDTKLYVLLVTLSTDDNAKLLQQLKS